MTLGGAHELLPCPGKIGLGWPQRGCSGVYVKPFHVETLRVPLYWRVPRRLSSSSPSWLTLARMGQGMTRTCCQHPAGPQTQHP